MDRLLQRQGLATVLLFADNGQYSKLGKSLRNSNRPTANFFRELHRHFRQISHGAGYDFHHLHAGLQKGNSFESRLLSALQQVQLQEDRAYFLIGNDTPELSAKLLKKAQGQLNRQKVVIGPSADGGIYLLAFQGGDFQAEWLHNLPFRQANFFQTLCERLSKLGLSLEFLPLLRDADSAGTLFALAHQARLLWLQKVLHFLNAAHYLPAREARQSLQHIDFPHDLRGPPAGFTPAIG